MDRLLHRGQTSERIDDNVVSIHKRLVTYREQTMPVKEWARKAGKLYEIDSSGTVDLVFASCCSIFESHKLAQ
jgi:UMP-CMP kinase